MTNTQLRIISALILILILVVTLFLGPSAVTLLLLITGGLLVDEFSHNMLKKSRSSAQHIIAVMIFLCGLIYLTFQTEISSWLLLFAMVSNWLWLIYLLLEKMESRRVLNIIKKNAYLAGPIFLLPFSCLLFLLKQPRWLELILLMLIMNFLVDSGAWFFGKLFGNKKLWPVISPKKTINGAIGGSLTSLVITSYLIYYFFDKLSFLLVLSVLGITFLAQAGDLIESKMKRQLGVKDSSNLIPGHGGIYDRLDSLIFVAPFYVIMVKYLI